jgi:hypothetical protein
VRRVSRVLPLVALVLGVAAGCSEPVSERFSVQKDGERYFVREKRGWFSALFPCEPKFSAVEFGSDKIKMVLANCQILDEVFSITFGRFKLPPGMAASGDQIYELAARGMDGWANRSSSSRVKMDVVTLAGRSGRYFSYQGDTGAATAHVWVLWAEEQQAIYQVMLVGKRGPTDGLRLARSMLVPSP